MAERQPKPLKLGVGQIGKNSEINVVLSERLRVLAETKSFEPLRDVVRHGASLRQAGFAEAVNQLFDLVADVDSQLVLKLPERHVGIEA